MQVTDVLVVERDRRDHAAVANCTYVCGDSGDEALCGDAGLAHYGDALGPLHIPERKELPHRRAGYTERRETMEPRGDRIALAFDD